MQSSDAVDELKMMWKVEPSKAYRVVIQHQGDMFNKLDEEDPCVYFDLIVAINTLNSLVDTLTCSNFESVASG